MTEKAKREDKMSEASVIPIKKPSFSENFKSKNAPTISGVQTLLHGVADPEDRRGRRLDQAASERRRVLDE